MLVVTRKVGEWVDIETADGTIRVQVAIASGGQVRLAFDAPKRVPILRGEMKDQTKDHIRELCRRAPGGAR